MWSSGEQNPYDNDDIYKEMNAGDTLEEAEEVLSKREEEEELKNKSSVSMIIDGQVVEFEEPDRLERTLQFYDAYDLLPLANHVMWLAHVKEAVGSLSMFKIPYDIIKLLVILDDEKHRKEQYDLKKSEEESRAQAGRIH